MQVTVDDNIKSVKIFKTNFDINCIKYTDDKKFIAAGCFDGAINTYNIKSTQHELCLYDADTKLVDNVCTGITSVSNKENVITCSYSGGLIKQWRLDKKECVFTIKEKRQTMGVVYHPKKPKLFAFGDDGKILMYDAETRKNELIYQCSESRKLDGHVTKIFSVCFNPAKPNEFISGGWDNVLYFWDVRVPSAVRSIPQIFIGGDGLTINKKGTQIVTCEWKRENPMKLWDYRTGKLVEVVKPDAQISQLYCGKFITDNMVATGGCDAHIFRIINMNSLTTVSSVKALPSAVYSLDVLMTKRPPPAQRFIDEFGDLPNVAFSAGKHIYEVRYR